MITKWRITSLHTLSDDALNPCRSHICQPHWCVLLFWRGTCWVQNQKLAVTSCWFCMFPVCCLIWSKSTQLVFIWIWCTKKISLMLTTYLFDYRHMEEADGHWFKQKKHSSKNTSAFSTKRFLTVALNHTGRWAVFDQQFYIFVCFCMQWIRKCTKQSHHGLAFFLLLWMARTHPYVVI